MLNVEPPLEHPPVSLTRATRSATESPVKPVARDGWSRRPDADSADVGPAKSLSITPTAGAPGSTGRRTAVTYGRVPVENRGRFSKYTFLGMVLNGCRCRSPLGSDS